MAFTENSEEEFVQLFNENKEEIETLMNIVINENKDVLKKLANQD
jgi:ribosomal protein S17E